MPVFVGAGHKGEIAAELTSESADGVLNLHVVHPEMTWYYRFDIFCRHDVADSLFLQPFDGFVGDFYLFVDL